MCEGLRKSRDLDVIVAEDVFDDYKDMPGWKIKEFRAGEFYLDKNDIELWKDWGPGEWDIQKLINEAEIIDGLPFVKLKEVLKWKKMIGRDKDIKDIKIIETYLADKN